MLFIAFCKIPYITIIFKNQIRANTKGTCTYLSKMYDDVCFFHENLNENLWMVVRHVLGSVAKFR